jgi:hypothetical protein
MRWKLHVFVGLSAALLAASFDSAGAQGDNCPLRIADLPEVVIDPPYGRLYAVGPDQHLTAFGTSDGSIVWRGETIQGVLGTISGKLLLWDRAGPRSLAFLLLDPSATPPRRTSIFTVDLPSWTQGTSTGATVVPTIENESCHLWLAWKVEQIYRGGPPPVSGQPETENKEAAGFLVIDAMGTIRASDRGPAEPASRSAPYRQGLKWRAAPFTVPRGSARLERKQTPAGDHLVIVYSDRTVDLGTGRDLLVMASMDGRLLFVADLRGTTAGWEIIDIATGRELGKLSLPSEMTAATLVSGRVYYLKQETRESARILRNILVATDGRDASQQWQQTLMQQQLTEPRP